MKDLKDRVDGNRYGRLWSIFCIIVVMSRIMAGLLLVATAAGCRSRPLGPYVSPGVIGRVVAADSHQPLAGVRVTRGEAYLSAAQRQRLKGAELLTLKAPALTDYEGKFAFGSERVLSIVRGSDWSYVSLSFELGGYERFHTNCSATLATNTAPDQPIMDAGTIFLQPAPK